MTEITIPTIHLNGSSKQVLMDDLLAAHRAIGVALNKMRQCTPNGRDYYPQGDGVTEKARAEHAERCRKLLEVHDELMEIAVGIDRQEGRRA